MSTGKQKEAARRNIEKAREVQSERAHGEDIPRSSEGMSTAEKDRLADAEFAFPSEREEPLSDIVAPGTSSGSRSPASVHPSCAGRSRGSRGSTVMVRASWVREVTPVFRNTLRRW
jgi:hypothetical protein